MKIPKICLLIAVAVTAIAAVFVYSGVFDVAADTPHSALVRRDVRGTPLLRVIATSTWKTDSEPPQSTLLRLIGDQTIRSLLAFALVTSPLAFDDKRWRSQYTGRSASCHRLRTALIAQYRSRNESPLRRTDILPETWRC